MGNLNYNKLRAPKAPNLPIAPNSYSHEYINLLTNTLRLYFNQLDLFSRYVSSPDFGSFWVFPHIAASDSTSQYATGNNVATLVKWNTPEDIYGFTLNSTTGYAQATSAGVYKITYSLQFANTDNAQHDIYVWLKVKSGSTITDVPRSASKFSIPARKSAGVYTYIVAYSEAEFRLNVGDEVALYWDTTKARIVSPATDGIYMEAIPASTSPARPAAPSALGSITFVSALTT